LEVQLLSNGILADAWPENVEIKRVFRYPELQMTPRCIAKLRPADKRADLFGGD
jgi:hypothetical protein